MSSSFGRTNRLPHIRLKEDIEIGPYDSIESGLEAQLSTEDFRGGLYVRSLRIRAYPQSTIYEISLAGETLKWLDSGILKRDKGYIIEWGWADSPKREEIVVHDVNVNVLVESDSVEIILFAKNAGTSNIGKVECGSEKLGSILTGTDPISVNKIINALNDQIKESYGDASLEKYELSESTDMQGFVIKKPEHISHLRGDTFGATQNSQNFMAVLSQVVREAGEEQGFGPVVLVFDHEKKRYRLEKMVEINPDAEIVVTYLHGGVDSTGEQLTDILRLEFAFGLFDHSVNKKEEKAVAVDGDGEVQEATHVVREESKDNAPSGGSTNPPAGGSSLKKPVYRVLDTDVNKNYFVPAVLNGEMSVIGNSDILPFDHMKLVGLGKTLSGLYKATTVSHNIGGDGFTTDIEIVTNTDVAIDE